MGVCVFLYVYVCVGQWPLIVYLYAGGGGCYCGWRDGDCSGRQHCGSHYGVMMPHIRVRLVMKETAMLLGRRRLCRILQHVLLRQRNERRCLDGYAVGVVITAQHQSGWSIRVVGGRLEKCCGRCSSGRVLLLRCGHCNCRGGRQRCGRRQSGRCGYGARGWGGCWRRWIRGAAVVGDVGLLLLRIHVAGVCCSNDTCFSCSCIAYVAVIIASVVGMVTKLLLLWLLLLLLRLNNDQVVFVASSDCWWTCWRCCHHGASRCRPLLLTGIGDHGGHYIGRRQYNRYVIVFTLFSPALAVGMIPTDSNTLINHLDLIICVEACSWGKKKDMGLVSENSSQSSYQEKQWKLLEK